MTDTRTNILVLVIGAKGTGKTHFIKEKLIGSSKQPKKFIIDTADNDIWRTMESHNNPSGKEVHINTITTDQLYTQPTGLTRLIEPDPDILFPEITRTTRNSLLIIEDGTRYIYGRLAKSFKDFVYDSKQRNNDIIIVFHALSSVPPQLITIVDKVVLFKTQETFPASKYPFPSIKHWMEKIRVHPSRYYCVAIPLS